MSYSSNTLERVKSESLLSIIPELDRLILFSGRVELLASGTYLCNEGELLSGLYICTSSPLSLEKRDRDGQTRVIGYVNKGRSVGLQYLMTSQPLPYSVRVESEQEIVRLPRQIFLEHLAKYPAVSRYLSVVTQSSGARDFKKLLEKLGLTVEQIVNILQNVELISSRHENSEQINLDESTLYFVDSGSIDIIAETDAKLKGQSVRLSEGTWFGGESIIAPFKNSYKAKTHGSTVLSKLNWNKTVDSQPDSSIDEAIYFDPWINKQQISYEREFERKLEMIEGTRIDAIAAGRIAPEIEPSKLSFANSLFESVVASLANLNYLRGFELDMGTIRSELSILQKITPLKLAQVVESSGMITSNIKSTFKDLHCQDLPALVKMKDRLTVIHSVNKNCALLIDPWQGFITITKEQFEAQSNGHILEIVKAETDRLIDASKLHTDIKKEDEKDAKEQHDYRLLTILSRNLRELTAVIWNRLGVLFVGMVLGLVMPKITSFLMDEAIETRSLSTVWVIVLGITLIKIYEQGTGFINGLARGQYLVKFDHKVTMLFLRHSMPAMAASRIKGAFGDAQARLGELDTIKQFLAESGFSIVQCIASIIIYTVVLLTYDWKVALISFCALPIVWGIRRLYRNRMRTNLDETFKNSQMFSETTAEQISAMAEIKSSASEKHMISKWETLYLSGAKLRRSMQLETSAVSGFVGFLTGAIRVGIFYFAFKMATKNEISIGDVFAIQMYVSSLIGPLTQLATLFDDIERQKVAQRKVTNVMSLPRSVSSSDKSNLAIKLSGNIKFEKVGFRYSDDTGWILKDLDFVIYPRQIVAVVGKSGCGKSTIAKLIAGLEKPNVGRIFFDYFDSAYFTSNCLKNQISLVLQSNELFKGSIWDNISFSDDAPSAEEVEKSAKTAGAAEFVESLPGGYQYNLAEGGMGISGGQKQRIAIARAIYQSPKILLLDEATSALDSESEASVMSNIRAMSEGRTTVIIAHRLSTVRYADRVLVVKDGKIVEDGTHKDLVKKEGYYYELFSEQISSSKNFGAVV